MPVIINSMKKFSNGFTIIELLVVIVIIGILSTISISSFSRIQADARDNQRKSRVVAITDALEKYYNKNGEYPSCNDIAYPNTSIETVATNILEGIDPNILTAPNINAGTNSVICTEPTNSDSFSYIVKENLLSYSLKYKEESSGKVISSTNERRSGWKQISVGSEHTCAISLDNKVYCWGRNNTGQLGINAYDDDPHTTPVAVNTTNGVSSLYGKTVTSISTGTGYTCALDSTGAVHCWGWNDNGQIGDNTTGTDRLAPVAVNIASGTSSLYGKTVTSISANGYHTCAIDSAGHVHCWGNNNQGAIGDNTTIDRLVPVAVID